MNVWIWTRENRDFSPRNIGIQPTWSSLAAGWWWKSKESRVLVIVCRDFWHRRLSSFQIFQLFQHSLRSTLMDDRESPVFIYYQGSLRGTVEQRSKPLCRGLYLGLNWEGPAKAKTQLTKAGRKLGEDQMDRDRRESFAKVDDWPILSSDMYIYMYHRLFWSYKLPKYGESSAKVVLSNVHRAKSRECGRESTAKGFAKAPSEYNEIIH